MIRAVFTSLCLGASLMSASALALTAEQVVEREVIVQNADGSQSVKREKADLVTPGDKVVYSLNYYNDKDEAAENIVLVMPIPAEVQYLDGTADADSVTTVYSVDGGKIFADRTDLMVSMEGGATRAARAEDITHIRWTISRAIAPGTSGTLSFKGRLK